MANDVPPEPWFALLDLAVRSVQDHPLVGSASILWYEAELPTNTAVVDMRDGSAWVITVERITDADPGKVWPPPE